MDKFQDKIVWLLGDQGFEERECDLVFDELVAKYRVDDRPFRRKLHLLHPDGAPEDE